MASRPNASGGRITLAGMLTRLAIALVLVHATWNPEGWSYLHWLVRPRPSGTPPGWLDNHALQLVVGLVLAIGWGIFLNAARRSLGWLGIGLVVALCVGVVWLLAAWDIVGPSSFRGLAHIALGILSVVLAVGISWPPGSRRITGQVGGSGAPSAG
jgi:hypothetical protein